MKRCALLLFVAAVAVGAYLLRANSGPGPDSGAASFVDPASCFECHEQQTDEWRGSHHELAMQAVGEQEVLADFTAHKGVEKRGDKYFMDGKEVRYVFGITPLQQYLVDVGGGRLQAHTTAWDTKENRWFDLNLDFEWTEPELNWNFMCAECHSTNLQRNYDPETDTYKTTFSEINVGCQACHGPGSNHVAWAKEHEDKSYELDDEKGLVVRLKDRDPEVETESCARCHSRRTIVSGGYKHGEPFGDHYQLSLLEPPLYHADGQIKDEVYVYGSFLQSKMYSKGVRCSDCHNSHSGRLRLEGNLVCARCHKENPPQEYETLKSKDYDNFEHHFHKEPKGITCVDCHMIERTYMVVDPRHDHSLRIPRPDLTAKYGTPNACNDCHKDKTAKWAADEIAKRVPKPPAAHFLEKRAADVLLDGKNYPAIVRATVARHLPGRIDLKKKALEDPSELVRAAAVRSLAGVAPHLLRRLLRPLLKDPIRMVRVEAAHVACQAGPWDDPDFAAALEELEARQRALSDRPESYFNLGTIAANLGNATRAEAMYRKAIAMDARFLPARFNLANLLNAQGRNAAAEEQLRAVLVHSPGNPEAYYSLGLLLAEMNRLEEAADYLEEASKRMPARARVHYNHGLILLRLARLDDAERALLAAYARARRDADILNALVHLYRQRRDPAKARRFAQELALQRR